MNATTGPPAIRPRWFGVKAALSLGFRATGLATFIATYTESKIRREANGVGSHYGIDDVPPQCDWRSNDSWR